MIKKCYINIHQRNQYSSTNLPFFTGKMSTGVKHMFKTTHVEHMFNMWKTHVKIHIYIFHMFNTCLIHMLNTCLKYISKTCVLLNICLTCVQHMLNKC